MLTKQLWKVFAHKESHHQLMAVPILSRTGVRMEQSTHFITANKAAKQTLAKSANPIPIFTLF